MTQLTERPIHHGGVAGTSRGGAAHAALWLLACGLAWLTGTAQAQAPATVTLANANITSGSTVVQAGTSITAGSGYTVSGSASVSFVAGGSIMLLPGFTATAGSAPVTFEASIGAAPAADFGVGITATSSTAITAGGSATYTVTVTPVNGFGGVVSLQASGLPSGATASFSPATVTGSGTSTMTVTTASGGGTGTFSPAVTGTSGALAHSAAATLTVSAAAAASFGMTVTATSATTVTAGGSVTYAVAVTAVNGFNSAVSFQAAGLPAGATATFSPATVTGSGTSTMTVTTSASGGTGTYTLTVTGSGGGVSQVAYGTLTANAAPAAGTNYTIAVVQGAATVAPGGTANFLLAVQPAGYPGQIGNLSMSIACHAVPSEGGYAWVSQPVLTLNADGTISVLVALAQTISSQCPGTQYDLTIPVSGGSQFSPPYIPMTNVALTLNVPSLGTPTLSLGAQLLSQTALSATYIVTGAANFTDTVSVGLQAGSCAYLIGHPAVALTGATGRTAQAAVRVSVGTLGCAPGVTTGLTFTGNAQTTNAPPASAAAQLTALTQTAMLSPAPGTLIPGGATTFTWRPGPGVTQFMLSVGSSAGAGDMYPSTAQTCTGAQTCSSPPVAVPGTAAAAYVTLSSWTGSAWQAQSYSYAVSAAPGTQALQLNGTPATAIVPANGQEVQFVYAFSAGDPRTVTAVQTSGAPVSARIAWATANALAVAYTSTAAPGSAAQQGQAMLESPVGTITVTISTEGGDIEIGNVTPWETTVNSQMAATINGPGYLGGDTGPGELEFFLCADQFGNGCQYVLDTVIEDDGGSAQFTSQYPGTYYLVVSTVDYWQSESDAESAVYPNPLTFYPVVTGAPPITLASFQWSYASAPGALLASLYYDSNNADWSQDALTDEGNAVFQNLFVADGGSPLENDPVAFAGGTKPAITNLVLMASAGFTGGATLRVQSDQSVLAFPDTPIQFDNGGANLNSPTGILAQALPATISKMSVNLTWSISFDGGQTFQPPFAQTNHTVFVTLGLPAGFTGGNGFTASPHVTARRVSYATGVLNGQTSPGGAVGAVQASVAQLFGPPGRNTLQKAYASNPWAAIAGPSTSAKLDCYNLAAIGAVQLLQAGINVGVSAGYPTPNGDATIPHYINDPQNINQQDVLLYYLGDGVTVNNYEGFLMLNQSGQPVSIYTFFPLMGPFLPWTSPTVAGMPATVLGQSAFEAIYQELANERSGAASPNGGQQWWFNSTTGLATTLGAVPFPGFTQ